MKNWRFAEAIASSSRQRQISRSTAIATAKDDTLFTPDGVRICPRRTAIGDQLRATLLKQPRRPSSLSPRQQVIKGRRWTRVVTRRASIRSVSGRRAQLAFCGPFSSVTPRNLETSSIRTPARPATGWRASSSKIVVSAQSRNHAGEDADHSPPHARSTRAG